MVRHAPRFSIEDAQRLASDFYAVSATASRLPSERDQNFRLRADSGRQFVLKIANPGESLEVLHLQNAMIRTLSDGDTGLDWPSVIPTRSGNLIVPAGSEGGTAYFVRLLTWVEGVCMAEAGPHSPAMLASLGQALGRIAATLARFDHPAAHRTLHWDLRQASMARRHLPLLSKAQRGLVDPIFHAWEAIDWSAMPESVIHNDANDYNVLVDSAGARVVSILDFGDAVHSATV